MRQSYDSVDASDPGFECTGDPRFERTGAPHVERAARQVILDPECASERVLRAATPLEPGKLGRAVPTK
jgi:hypothetical protein